LSKGDKTKKELKKVITTIGYQGGKIEKRRNEKRPWGGATTESLANLSGKNRILKGGQRQKKKKFQISKEGPHWG